MAFKAGDSVYYIPNGEEDTGKITSVSLDPFQYEVVWDKDGEVDWFKPIDLHIVSNYPNMYSGEPM